MKLSSVGVHAAGTVANEAVKRPLHHRLGDTCNFPNTSEFRGARGGAAFDGLADHVVVTHGDGKGQGTPSNNGRGRGESSSYHEYVLAASMGWLCVFSVVNTL